MIIFLMVSWAGPLVLWKFFKNLVGVTTNVLFATSAAPATPP